MADPTGLSGALLGALVAKLLDQAIDATTKIINCKSDGRALMKLLKTIQPLVLIAARDVSTNETAAVSNVAASPPRDHPKDANVKFGTESELGAVEKWLEDLRSLLVEAKDLVWECDRIKSYNLPKLHKMSKKILTVKSQIAEICTIQAPLAALNIGVGTAQGVEKLLQVLARLTLDMDTTKEIMGRLERIAASVDKLAAGQTSDSQQSDHEDEIRPLSGKSFGMETPLADLRGLLLGAVKNVKWVGVSGMGGLGKTRLATEAYNRKDIRDHFQKKLWLEVGRNPSIEQLLYQLAGHLQVKTDNYMKSDQIKTKIFNALLGKKVLLCIDDVWEDRGVAVLDALDVISEQDTDSKILVTTRHKKVLQMKIPQGKSIIEMEYLSVDNSWELFCDSAFGGVDNIPLALEEELVKAVVAECKGLPLALKVIAGGLVGQESPQQWQRVLKRLKEAIPLDTDQEVQLYHRLQLSYESLEFVEYDHRHRLQKCFVYFAAFPEDSDVESEKLVDLWIGENLVEASDDGYYLLYELIGRSLVELREEKWSDDWNHIKLTCRVHDVLRDFARFLISSQKLAHNMMCLFRAGEGLTRFPDQWLTPKQELGGPSPISNATHLSLSDNELESESLPTNLKAPRLEVLLLANNHKSILAGLNLDHKLVIPPGFFDNFSSLKVLDLGNTGIDSLPESLENLTNLVHLELVNASHRLKLPQGLRKLTRLKYLGLAWGINMEPWPFDISDLKSLSTLNTEHCRYIWEPSLQEPKVPRSEVLIETSDPTTSEEMEILRTAPPTLDSLQSLCSLTSLRNLSIQGAREHLPSKMAQLVNLCHLNISFRRLKTLPPELHSSTGPRLSQLQYLSLSGCEDLSELPSWVDSLSQLANLSLFNCRKLTALPNLHKLPKLRKLDLGNCESLQELPTGFASKGAFLSLRVLSISGCLGLREFPPIRWSRPSDLKNNDKGAFPKLTVLHMEGCSNLEKLPPGFTSSRAFPSLKELYMGDCQELRDFLPIEEGAFPQLMILDLENSVVQKLPSSLRLLPKLQKLNLRGCRQIKNLYDCFPLQENDSSDPTSQFHHTLPYFPNLQELLLYGVLLDILPHHLAACPALKKIDLTEGYVTFNDYKVPLIPKNLLTLQAEGKLTILVDEDEDEDEEDEDEDEEDEEYEEDIRE